jgi:site-specific DNA-methyltransferase (adenine-specific)
MIKLHNIDNMKYMAECDDNAFDLAIVDPPYGINADGGVGSSNLGESKKYKSKWDDSIPEKRYFQEIKRVSKNQIIWGGNYFIDHLNNTSCFIVWDKDNTGNFADCELAWASFDTAVRKFKHRWNGMLQEDMKNKETRIHPTQKPVALYKWLLKNYAKEGDIILDTHLGSGSIAIACHDMGFDLVGCELDKDYYDGAKKRLKNHTDQNTFF